MEMFNFNIMTWFHGLGPREQEFWISLTVGILAMVIGTLILSVIKNVNPISGFKLAYLFIWKIIKWLFQKLTWLSDKLVEWVIRDAVVRIMNEERFSEIIHDSNDVFSSMDYREIKNPDFIVADSCTIAIWAEVTKVHLSSVGKGYLYVFGHATGTHTPRPVGKGSYYANAFAVGNMPGSTRSWRGFFDNEKGDVEQTNLEVKRALTEGWHLFILKWDRQRGIVRFQIDLAPEFGSEIAIKGFPEKAGQSLVIGTWADRTAGHNLDSRIGPFRIWRKCVSDQVLREYWKRSHPR